MKKITLHIEIYDGKHVQIIASSGNPCAMSTNKINRLTIKKILKFMNIDLEEQ